MATRQTLLLGGAEWGAFELPPISSTTVITKAAQTLQLKARYRYPR